MTHNSWKWSLIELVYQYSVASIVLCDVVLYCLKLFRGSLTYEIVFSAQVCDVVFCQHQLTVTNVYSTRRMLPIV